ncbi:hypothetical protein F5148DRAFT_1292181 [Russula earlei]|uniref:Uncharacterized protein n=1 Tax=Russula earlei TaxID=71964 RepID=A0ACC0TUN1_9AGAM|nr:hypothetical protein F5148DRAFT_1292181 [Russula earlei]
MRAAWKRPGGTYESVIHAAVLQRQVITSRNAWRRKVHANAFAGRAHGTGLRKVLKDGKSIPEIFDGPLALVKRASHWVVPVGFGIAYITGFDDYMQFTITSRAEMPNEEFAAEISRRADDLYSLYFQRKVPTKWRL